MSWGRCLEISGEAEQPAVAGHVRGVTKSIFLLLTDLQEDLKMTSNQIRASKPPPVELVCKTLAEAL